VRCGAADGERQSKAAVTWYGCAALRRVLCAACSGTTYGNLWGRQAGLFDRAGELFMGVLLGGAHTHGWCAAPQRAGSMEGCAQQPGARVPCCLLPTHSAHT